MPIPCCATAATLLGRNAIWCGKECAHSDSRSFTLAPKNSNSIAPLVVATPRGMMLFARLANEKEKRRLMRRVMVVAPGTCRFATHCILPNICDCPLYFLRLTPLFSQKLAASPFQFHLFLHFHPIFAYVENDHEISGQKSVFGWRNIKRPPGAVPPST
jgi:hypothetical protein